MNSAQDPPREAEMHFSKKEKKKKKKEKESADADTQLINGIQMGIKTQRE